MTGHDACPSKVLLDQANAEVERLKYVVEAVRAFRSFPSEINKHVVFARLAEADAAAA